MSVLALPPTGLTMGSRAARRRHLSVVSGGSARRSAPAAPTRGALALVASPASSPLTGRALPAPALVPVGARALSDPARVPSTRPPARRRAAVTTAPVELAAPPARTARVEAARPAADAVAWRLTARGRRVLVLLGFLAAAGLGALLGFAFPANEAGTGEVASVTVSAGESLWTIASEAAAPGQDVRVVVDQIMDLNGLESSMVQAGQRLAVPAG